MLDTEPGLIAHVSAAPRLVLSARTAERGRWHRVGLVVALLALAIVVLWALMPGVMTSSSPLATDPSERLQAPSWQHPFGTPRC